MHDDLDDHTSSTRSPRTCSEKEHSGDPFILDCSVFPHAMNRNARFVVDAIMIFMVEG